jgi:glutathione S-transferase
MMPEQEIVVWGIGTPRTLRVHWALHELDVPYTSEPVRTRTSAMDANEFLAVSPGKKIPAFRHGSLLLTESGAITRYVMTNFSSVSWTAAERATIDRWTFFALMELDATALYVLRRHEGLAQIYGEAPAAVAAARAYLERQLGVLDAALGARPYVLDERFSEADIHLGTCLDWAVAVGIALQQATAAYQARLHDRPAYARACRANGTPR